MNSSLKKCIESICDPITGLSYESQVELTDNKVTFRFPFVGLETQLKQSLSTCFNNTEFSLDSTIKTHKSKKGIKPLKGVKNIIAVASGKGGVGKSTITVMLAKSLQKLGAKVAILDADIYGPSMPKMLGDYGKPGSPDNKSFTPVDANGIASMSLGYMIDEESPAIWRGSMITRALMQMVEETRWSEVDYLLIDLPPGTGDIQLTMVQKIPVTATIIVTTPQDISMIDAQKAFKMFEKVEIPVLGIIENMSVFQCPNCQHESHIFGQGAADKMLKKFDTHLLGHLPLNIKIRQEMDDGKPENLWGINTEIATQGMAIALKTAQLLAKLPININLNNLELKLHNI
ncbi:[4Fe-4S] cluster assembly scaffold protein Mrp (=ApbC) [hydrothermal vent metagenome]|uniref:[4Fe-4S] cluster assembly scaffold protein Mrp (=ApbC) n=1 Tax=hydrothermal vent metagenome TaxID=652676 RepID=A0A3B0VY50_9ZZZZ